MHVIHRLSVVRDAGTLLAVMLAVSAALALVPAEPAVAAASLTRPPAFMIVAPTGD